MRRGRQNFEYKLFGCKNGPYIGQINVRWWVKNIWVQKSPGGAKKLQGCQKATFFSFFLGDSKNFVLCRRQKFQPRGAEW